MNKAGLQYQNLSVKDLLDAREAFHIHLMKKQNVVGTAIGKYRMRLTAGKNVKRLDNTKVTENSWPCILVFVRKWLSSKDFKTEEDFNNFIPSNVYLPDGREVPLCVVEAP